MNRREIIVGAAALAAASTVRIAQAVPMDGHEFVRIVIGLPAAEQAAFASMLRAIPNKVAGVDRMADLIDQLARQNGWVRGEQHAALLREVVS
jgi:hypothetical protein